MTTPHLPDRFQRLGMVARWRPVHLGHTPVLRALCNRAEETFIGIGSANRYNYRVPFTLEETTAMLRLELPQAGYRLIPVPDLDDGPRWRAMILELFGPLDAFVTANPYVATLLADDYPIIHPVELVPPAERIPIDGTQVRRAMARGDGWRELVPPAVADYLSRHRLDERFRNEFGLQTLAMETIITQPDE